MKTSSYSHAHPFRIALGIAVTLLLAGPSVVFAENTNENANPNGIDLQGIDLQGIDLQGIDLQGIDLQGPLVSSGLRGDTFVAILPNGDTIEVHSFRGDEVDVTVQGSSSNITTDATIPTQQLDGMVWYAPLCDDDNCVDTWYRASGGIADDSTNTMPGHGSNSDIWLYRVELATDPVNGTWHNVCGSESDPKGMFVNGIWNQDGTWNSVGFSFSCPIGVVAKCSRGWGYKPWTSLTSDNGTVVDMQPLHQACTRAARADYCGDGMTHTVNGLLVDIHDVYGFNVNEYTPGLSEEASFDTYGGISLKRRRVVNHPNPIQCQLPKRVPQNETPLLRVWSQPTVQLRSNRGN